MRKLALAVMTVAGTLYAAAALADVAPPRRGKAPPPPPPFVAPPPPPPIIPPPPVVVFNPWYWSISGHYVWSDWDAKFDYHHHDVHLDFKSGFSIYGALGYRFGPWFAMELEVGYLDIGSDSSNDFTGRGRGASRPLRVDDGGINGIGIFVNALLTWPVGDWITPYVGAGIGGVFQTGDEFTVSRTGRNGNVYKRHVSNDDFNFAFQIKAGLDFRLWPGVTLGPEYRFTWVDWDSNYRNTRSNANGDDGDSLYVHAVGAVLKFNF